SGRASVSATSALALEQNHLSPQSRHVPSASQRATVVLVPTSEPPVLSVIHCVPCQSVSKSVVVSRGKYAACNSLLPYMRSMREVESVTETGHSKPNSD